MKVGPWFFGPSRVPERIGEVAYRLDLPGNCRRQPTFHVSRLRKAEGPMDCPQPVRSHHIEDHEWVVEPQEFKMSFAGSDEPRAKGGFPSPTSRPPAPGYTLVLHQSMAMRRVRNGRRRSFHPHLVFKWRRPWTV